MSAKVTGLIKGEEFTYSFEVTPNVSFDVIDKLNVEPQFVAITWHARSQKTNSLDNEPLKLASHLRSKGKNVLLHLSCDLLKRDYLNKLLKFLQEKRICNLFVMLGESYDRKGSDFQNSKELIEYIRKQTGNYFCIGVAGFPDQSQDKLLQLKDKIDSGADFIITQAFFELNVYKNYVERCQKIGIKIPIIPGIFLFETYQQLVGFTNMCKVKVSNDLLEYVKCSETISEIELVKTLVKELRKEGTHHIHFFTLNKLDQVCGFIKDIEKS